MKDGARRPALFVWRRRAHLEAARGAHAPHSHAPDLSRACVDPMPPCLLAFVVVTAANRSGGNHRC